MRGRRLILSLLALAVLMAVAWVGWLVLRVQDDLTAAQLSAYRLRDALEREDGQTSKAALADLQRQASSAAERTDGFTWSALTHVPVVGDDAAGVRTLSDSLRLISDRGLPPLVNSVDRLGAVTSRGRLDIDTVEGLRSPVSSAERSFSTAAARLDAADSSGYFDRLRSRFDNYHSMVSDVDRALSSASTTAEVLPTLAGGSGPRNYLLVFQNNAEIRATGGMPGSWAVLHADRGRLTLTKQGTAGQFGERPSPVLPLTGAERSVFGEQLGVYFQDATLTPDFPRAAQIMASRWEEAYPAAHLDGVMSLDPVAMSYLLDGTGPVKAAGTTLTSKNFVDTLLSRPYQTLDPLAQDALFKGAARAIFAATTKKLDSPMKIIEGLDRAAREGRLLMASFDPAVRSKLSGTRVEGALATDDGATPHVDIALNDGTGSKMSYYLRYWADLRATKCDSGVQTLVGSLSLHQDIDAARAAKLPESVTGGGRYGTKPGHQLVVIPLIGPQGGSIDEVWVNGRSLGKNPVVDHLDGRPVMSVVAELSSPEDVVFNFTMHTGKGETGDVELGMTPSIVPGSNDATFKSAC